jgi:hypothetical protein
MTYKPTMPINKAWFNAGLLGFSPASFIARLKSALRFEIPTGYQDETGFHLGAKAEEREINWPANW